MARGEVRDVYTGEEVRLKALAGAEKVYQAVAAAYSPTSGNVALEKSYGSYVISHDGVSIARDIVLADKQEDIGADLLQQASRKSNDVAGDGTTVTILLGYHIMVEANKRIAAGFNPMGIRRGIDKAALVIKQAIADKAVPVADGDLAKVATISASDPEVGKLVADTILKVGGVGISIEEYDGLGVIQDVVEGLYFEKGYAAPHFVTDRETEEAVLENTSILAIEKRISSNQDIVPILEMLYKETDNKTVVIIGNISGQALETCALTAIAGKIKVLVVNPPVYGDQMLPFLEDIAIVTGGKVIPNSLPADKVTPDYAGYARKVVATNTDTTILEGNGIEEDIANRIETLTKQLESDKYSAFQRERIERRLSKLNGKIGIIRVGGATESEIKEMKFRVEDAVHATRAAKEEGIVAGGAVTLAQLSKVIKDQDLTSLTPDEQEGFKCVYSALTKPFKQLMANAGEDGGYRLGLVLQAQAGHGFDVKNMTDEPIDLIKAGVIDPAKVLRCAIENASSAAGIAITLNGSILINKEAQLEQVQFNKAIQ